MRFIPALALVLAPLAAAPGVVIAQSSDSAFRDAIARYTRSHQAEILGEFRELLAIPNRASDSANIRRNADAIVGMLQRRGATTRLLESPTGGPPVVFGELRTPGATRTVVLYAHYDGQPVEAGKWATPPWEPTLRDGPLEHGGRFVPFPAAGDTTNREWRLYARSAGDDKAPIVAMLTALDALRANGMSPSVNLKFYFDGEEEAGNGNTSALLKKHGSLLASDGWVFADGPVHQSRRQQVLFGVRGVTDVVITAYGATRALHSGHYGNWAPNPAAVLANFVASLRDADGKVLIPGYYDDVRPLTAADRRALATMPAVDSALRQELELGATEAHDARLAERIMQPALNVRSFHAGPEGAAANAIPTEATVSIDFRLVPDERPERIRQMVEAYATKQGYMVIHAAPDSATRMQHGRLLRFDWGEDGYPGQRTRSDTPLARGVVQAVSDALGAPIIEVPMLGGSLPTYLFAEALSAPLVIVPIANHDDNQHASNENLRLQNLWDGIAVFAGIEAKLGRAWSAAPVAPAAQRTAAPSSRQPYEVTETTIADIHEAMRGGTLSCHDLVSAYLARIAAYDKTGPAINSIIVVNPKAMAVADSLDRHVAAGGAMGALHCVPMIVKDNFETKDLPTTAGSLSLQGLQPAQDAFMVRRLREAGAIVLAKSNMAEFAFTPYETVSSILPGYTKNPYALDRVTAGSSGGSAAAVAANLGEAALGTDTGNSIRGPSSHQALVGIRSTMGLTSRDGVAPLNLAADIAGPMARSVADAVAIFQVVAGEDAADTVTARSRGHRAADYTVYLKRDALKGARIGVLHQAYDRDSADPEVIRVFDAALDDMRRQGATIVDPVAVAGLDEHLKAWTGSCNQFRHDIEEWLARQGSRAPVHTVAEIIKSRRFHPSIRPQLEAAQAESLPPSRNPGCRNRDEFRAWLRTAVTSTMDSLHLDALVYPTWSNAPRLIGDLNTPAGDNSQLFSPSTGYPAITVPMGYTHGQLPAGMTLFGRAWSEPALISLAYAYEQATHHRRAPGSVPPLR